MLERQKIRTKREWLKARKNRGIGGSEAAAIVNMSPYMSSSELLDIKKGKKKHKDISKNEYVSLGVRCEKPLRELFKAIHKDSKVEYHAYDLLYQKELPWLFATLDGEITENEKKGILEIKTSTPIGKQGWDKWDGHVPDNYYVQVLHQLLATGWDFAIVFACLFGRDGSSVIREYRFDREDVEEDLEWLRKQEIEFMDSVTNDKIPKLSLVF